MLELARVVADHAPERGSTAPQGFIQVSEGVRRLLPAPERDEAIVRSFARDGCQMIEARKGRFPQARACAMVGLEQLP